MPFLHDADLVVVEPRGSNSRALQLAYISTTLLSVTQSFDRRTNTILVTFPEHRAFGPIPGSLPERTVTHSRVLEV